MISRILRDLSIIFDILVRNFFTPYRITLTCASVLQNHSRANSQFKWNMTWMNKVRSHCHSLSFLFPLLRRNFPDQEWLDAVNAERKKEQLNPISYEIFEIIIDRLEKEWFDLVIATYTFKHSRLYAHTCLILDEKHSET